MFKTTCKLIFRNWWRNKTFTLISIISLTVGIAFFNLLFSFVVYEQGIEKSNPNYKRMVWALQDMPSSPGEKVAYMTAGIPEQIKGTYPEVEDYLQLNSSVIQYVEVDNQRFDPIEIINVSNSFSSFFPFEILFGSWDVLNNPQSMVISDKQAHKIFGRADVIGKQLSICEKDFDADIRKTYTIGAVTRARKQSAITFDALICNPEANWGGPTLLMMREDYNLKQFEAKVKSEDIPTLAGGQYYFVTLHDALSSRYQQQGVRFWHYRNDTLLMIGLISALLLLIIALFNYLNISFSRLLQQVKILQIQKLMGAKQIDLRLQIFLDALFIVFISFLLALPLMHDLLPLFNQVVDAEFSSFFFYSNGFFPMLILLLLLATIIPSWMTSSWIARSTGSEIRNFFITKKHRWVGGMVTMQFVISIALIISTLTVNNQVSLVKKHAARYQNLIEIEMKASADGQELQKTAQQIRDIQGVEELSMGNMSLMNSWIMHGTLKRENGEEFQTMVLHLGGDDGLIQLLRLKQLAGQPWETVSNTQFHSVFVNQSFADKLHIPAEKLIGEPLGKYLISGDSVSIIAGVVDNFHFSSLEDEVMGVLIEKIPNYSEAMTTMLIRLDGIDNKKTLASIKELWQHSYPNEYFTYTDIEDVFMKRNSEIFEMEKLLQMYSLISILLTCFGLFGISFYTVRQRTKEIGIRKINGANTIQILWLLIKPMLLWLATGFLIALPLSWYFIEKWLQQFVYRVDISVGSFLFAFLLVMGVTLFTTGWHVCRTARAYPIKCLRSD